MFMARLKPGPSDQLTTVRVGAFLGPCSGSALPISLQLCVLLRLYGPVQTGPFRSSGHAAPAFMAGPCSPRWARNPGLFRREASEKAPIFILASAENNYAIFLSQKSPVFIGVLTICRASGGLTRFWRSGEESVPQGLKPPVVW